MPHPPRLANGYRDYQAVHQERLLFIRHCRSLDMPLADIHSLLDMTQANACTHLHAESLVSNHIDRVAQNNQLARTAWPASKPARKLP